MLIFALLLQTGSFICFHFSPHLRVIWPKVWFGSSWYKIKHWARKLVSPRARRVQIDTDPLLVKHICQMEDSPAARDRCWWSKLFTGDLRRLNRSHPLRYKGKCPKLADNSEMCLQKCVLSVCRDDLGFVNKNKIFVYIFALRKYVFELESDTNYITIIFSVDPRILSTFLLVF